jgi:hypothetical protein
MVIASGACICLSSMSHDQGISLPWSTRTSYGISLSSAGVDPPTSSAVSTHVTHPAIFPSSHPYLKVLSILSLLGKYFLFFFFPKRTGIRESTAMFVEYHLYSLNRRL